MTDAQPVLLLTRPQEASERFATQLPAEVLLSVQLCISPLLEIAQRDVAVDMSGFRGLIFSSSNGVAAAARCVTDRSLPAFCVGEATTRAAAKAGWLALQKGVDAESLVSELLRDPPDGPLLHLHGRFTRGDIAQNLSANGMSCSALVLYEQKKRAFSEQAVQLLNGTTPVIAPVFSPRTAQIFSEIAVMAPLHVIAISQAVAAEFSKAPCRSVDIAETPDAQTMVRLVEKRVLSVLSG